MADQICARNYIGDNSNISAILLFYRRFSEYIYRYLTYISDYMSNIDSSALNDTFHRIATL
ncbi:hypothetical protein bcgnr5380_45100 [Bacillus cereus]